MQHIKQMIKDYATSYKKDWFLTRDTCNLSLEVYNMRRPVPYHRPHILWNVISKRSSSILQKSVATAHAASLWTAVWVKWGLVWLIIHRDTEKEWNYGPVLFSYLTCIYDCIIVLFFFFLVLCGTVYYSYGFLRQMHLMIIRFSSPNFFLVRCCSWIPCTNCDQFWHFLVW